MDLISNFFIDLHESWGNGLWALLFFVGIIGIVAQWRLYTKASLPGFHCLIPIVNIITFLKVIGRPASHILLFFIPIYNIYFIIKIYVELCNSFGKNSILDYVLVILLNGLYILNLGLAYDTYYRGPVYGLSKEELKTLLSKKKKH
ncbi:MAG: hypothetical protein ACJAUV_001918 [Flavobacteriales bacterium]|jgi:hypothetical protein